MLVLSPVSAPPSASPQIPLGEARGQFAISPQANPDRSLSGVGSAAGTNTAGELGVGSSSGAAAGNGAGNGAGDRRAAARGGEGQAAAAVWARELRPVQGTGLEPVTEPEPGRARVLAQDRLPA